MKGFAGAILVAGLGSAFVPLAPKKPTVLLLSGDTDGYLAPCGCTKPMSGGIRRRVQAVRSLSVKGRTLVLENGGLVSGSSRQDQIKAETLAEIMGKAGWDAINLGPAEGQLGTGSVLTLHSLSGGKLLASGLLSSNALDIKRSLVKAPFLVVGVTSAHDVLGDQLGEEVEPLDATVSRAADEARSLGLAPIALLQGDLAAARALAKRFPSLALVQYRSAGSPAKLPLKEGRTWLVSPGEKAKHILRLEFANGRFLSYQPVELTPMFADDAAATRLYRNYLGRLRGERLLDKMPRAETPAFAGNKRCGSCHAGAMNVWVKSKHAGALATLEHVGHDADPDCVACHVVGLESAKGFLSRAKTPQLANVGCESCHGPGLAHAVSPTNYRMPKVGERPCMTCHVSDHSPGFQFEAYWKKIRH